MKSESSLTLRRQQGSYHNQGTERYKDIVKIVHVASVVHPQFYEATKIDSVRKEKKIFYNNNNNEHLKKNDCISSFSMDNDFKGDLLCSFLQDVK